MFGLRFWGKFFGVRYWGKAGADPVEPPPPAVPGSNPVMSMRASFDGGITFSAAYERPMGKAGEYKKRIFWNRIGTGNDPVLEVFGSDAVKIALTGAILDVEILRSPGRGVAAKDGPQMTMRISYDSGHTWSAGYERSMGRIGENLAVCAWNRPGMGRDCVIEVSGSAAVKIALTGANFDLEQLRA